MTDLIASTKQDVLDLCGVADDSNSNISLAVKYSVLAAVLRYLKTTDELAPTYETPGSKTQRTTDKDIDFWQAKADKITQPYENAKVEMMSLYSSPSCHVGFDCGGR